VIGLTTAATIWLVASVGMAFGAGLFELGALGTILATGVLFGLGVVEHRLENWRTLAHFEIELEKEAQPSEVLERVARQTGVRLTVWSMEKRRDGLAGGLTVLGSADRLHQFQQALMSEATVNTLRRL
jgi:uncharacterized membrane protein YhiD involved in acid resistance